MDWCLLNYLEINPSKIKELAVDFRRTNTHPTGEYQRMECCSWCPIHVTWVFILRRKQTCLNTGILQKGPEQTFLGIENTSPVYDSLLAFGIFFGSSITAVVEKKLNRQSSRCYLLGCTLNSVEAVGERRMMTKLHP